MEVVDSQREKSIELALSTVIAGLRSHGEGCELSASLGLTPNTATPLEKGPRRSAADRGKDIVWVCEFFADRLAKIDAKTRKVTEYPCRTASASPIPRP